MGMDRDKAYKMFANYESVRSRIVALQDIVRNPDFVTEECVEVMLNDSHIQTRAIKLMLDDLQKEIEGALEEVRARKELGKSK